MTRRGPKSKIPEKVTLDLTKLQVRKGVVGEALLRGTKDEVRRELDFLGSRIRHGHWETIRPHEAEFLGAALEAIGRGVDPAVALGLNRRHRTSLGLLRAQRELVDALTDQNMPETVALDIVARLRERRNADGTYTTYLAALRGAGDKLRKSFKRHLK